MHAKNQGDYPRDSSPKISFIQRHLRLVILWPLSALLLIALLWGAVYSKLENDKRILQENAAKQAVSISKAYAQYLTRSIEQLDQLAQQIKYGWEQSKGYLGFEEMIGKGLLNVPQFSSVAIYDVDGLPLTTSIPVTQMFTVADREYFKFHAQNASTELRISTPTIGRLSKEKIVQVTRRLENADGTFAGVLVLGLAPEFFTLFSDDPILGHDGVLAFIGNDGIERVAQMRGRKDDALSLVSFPMRAEYTAPNITSNARQYSDIDTHFIATQKLKGYPFYVMVGLSKEDILLPYENNLAMYRKIGIIGSVLLLLFAGTAMWMSIRLAWRKQQANAIRETYRIATEGGNEGFYILLPTRDRNQYITDFQVVDCNEKGSSFYNMSKDKFTGVKVSDFYSGEYFEKVMQAYRIAMETGFFEDDYEVPPDSPVDAEWLKRKFVRSENGLAITLRDISEPKRHEREMARLATEDGLTALPNRHWFMAYLPKALEHAKANSTMLAILFIDLDDFKNINDTLGHSAGDQLLCTVAQRLRSVLRPTDKVIRIGGDEFTVILEAIHSEEEAAHIAFRINQVLQEPFDFSRDSGSQKNKIGGSIGISIFPRDGEDVETLVKNADIAMYAAKTDSKGQFRFYDRTLYESIKMRINTEQELMQAIKDDQFIIYYQPRVQTQTGKLLGMEALIRWQHPTRGLVMPHDFISLAEETGLINPIGELVVDKVCAQLANWLKQGVTAVPVSVNVSPHQFNEGKVKKSLAASLDKYAVPASLLEIELTESAMMRNVGDIFDELTAINKMGIKVHVDDFGSGYSSLALLQRLDMDILKIDQAFTSQLGRGKDGEIFFTAIVSMAKALGMRVVAEGVETLEQLHILQTLACDEVQGYYVAWPLPADNIAEIIRKQNLFP